MLTADAATGSPSSASVEAPLRQQDSVIYHIVTNEVSAKQKDGSEVEVYRFDPGVFVASQGDDVKLEIRGVKGHDHPVVLKGYGVSGTVHRNQTLDLHFRADKPGIFPLVCTLHPDAQHQGPMEGYLVVVPKNA